jgi:hypothetical protein
MIPSNRIVHACEFASEKHRDHYRMGAQKYPYLSHLSSVALLLAITGADEDTIIAGILHDCVEDVGVTHDELVQEFGDRVAHLVSCVTEKKDLPPLQRKISYCKVLSQSEPAAVHISAADWVANCESGIIDSGQIFPPGYSESKKQEMTPVYHERFSIISQKLGTDHPLTVRLQELLQGVIS